MLNNYIVIAFVYFYFSLVLVVFTTRRSDKATYNDDDDRLIGDSRAVPLKDNPLYGVEDDAGDEELKTQ